ncbi:SDR family NAD(P)-dependent oxidoreductase [Micromonospora sp. NPDC005171]|uniref:SDR family oxidoreductase n=1 Tax=Micromonospora sp. NPDC005171 TaxID=3156866 RepID=UPI0033BE849C
MVTGGGNGIGRAIAEHLVAAGIEVIITGRRAQVLRQTAAELGPLARALDFDASDPDAVEAAVAQLPGTIDILVNNAGGATEYAYSTPPRHQLKELREAWLRNIEANLMISTRPVNCADSAPRRPCG